MATENRILLQENHRRSLSSTLMIVEQLLIEIEDLTNLQNRTCCFEIRNDIAKETSDKNLKAIEEARKLICKLAEKYNTDKTIQSLQRIVDAKKAKIWEILCDSKAIKQKGFGEFPTKLVKEFDLDIDELLTITDKLKF
jgi:hypothetical protein